MKLNRFKLDEAIAFIKKDKSFLNMSGKQLIEYFKASPDRLNALQQWAASFKNNPDYSVYNTDGYVDDGILCYLYPSQMSIYGTLKWLQKTHPDTWQDLTYFDDYNGVGLTTLLLLENCKNVTFFNDVPAQIASFNDLCNLFGFNVPLNDTTRIPVGDNPPEQNKYDVVFSLQVVEHYLNPIEDYLTHLTKMVKDDGYLVYMHGFANGGDKRIGHFDDGIYQNSGLPVKRRQISKKCKQFLNQQGFELIPDKFYNMNPTIYKKVR